MKHDKDNYSNPQPSYEALCSRLKHLEAIINGIVTGEVDAIVIDQDISLIRLEKYVKHTQNQLRESRENLKSLFDALTDYIFVINNQGLIVYCNPAIEQLGYGQTDLNNHPYTNLFSKDNSTPLDLKMEHTIHYLTNDYRKLVTKNGETIILETRIAKGKWDGEDVIFAISRDITHRFNYEREIEHTRQLAEYANQAKSEFIANLSHELRTPLNGIMGYSQILTRQTALSDHQKQMVDIIYRNSNYLLKLMNDILDLSKIESGVFELTQAPFRLDDFIKDISGFAKLRAQQEGLEFSLHAENLEPEWIIGNEKYLKQILLNLINNAAKFTSEGFFALHVSITNDRLCFCVEDTGIGISSDQLNKIFIKFHRINSPNSCKEGAGLGLSICRKLVRMMKGELFVQSEINSGSKFWFDIPLIKPTNGYAEKHQRIIKGIQVQQTIVIVDDEYEHLQLLQSFFSSLGFKIFPTMNGKEALELARTHKPLFMIVDILLPVSDGIQIIKQIKSIPDFQFINIIAISAHVNEETKNTILNAGAHAFISKPIDFNNLLKSMDQLSNIDWIYDYHPTNHTNYRKKKNSLPPMPVLINLEKIAANGDIVGIQNYIKNIQDRYPEQEHFFNQLQKLALDMKINQVESLIQTSKESIASTEDIGEVYV